ncbi:hypothetical protein SSX86_024242 [Deinandra increscens subsp. villosa]|uniref:Uncharacterized protein n=1 Tax=Deinandra increscens subsp. villosa TaxID=3103831 RepID=A0AAP0GNH2_9ASTR
MKGLNNIDVRYVGGMHLVLAFCGSIEANKFLEQQKHAWSLVFKNLKLWEEHDMPNNRIAEITIRGVPFNLRREETFNAIDVISITNIYGPQDSLLKLALWNELDTVIDPDLSGLLIGDYNVVRQENERLNSVFCQVDADRKCLKEIKLEGRKFTYMSKDGTKLSKLDRAFATLALLRMWSGDVLTALP